MTGDEERIRGCVKLKNGNNNNMIIGEDNNGQTSGRQSTPFKFTPGSIPNPLRLHSKSTKVVVSSKATDIATPKPVVNKSLEDFKHVDSDPVVNKKLDNCGPLAPNSHNSSECGEFHDHSVNVNSAHKSPNCTVANDHGDPTRLVIDQSDGSQWANNDDFNSQENDEGSGHNHDQESVVFSNQELNQWSREKLIQEYLILQDSVGALKSNVIF